MRQKAVVLETEGNIALIEVSRASMCEGCKKNSGCDHHCDISGIMSTGGKMQAKAENKIGAKIGETVEVETESRKVLGYATLVFIVPIIICAVCYYIASMITSNEGITVAAAAVGFVLTFAVIAAADREITKKAPDIKIVRRIDDNQRS